MNMAVDRTGPSPETRFGLIRHAVTEWNRQRRIQGQQDSALTPEGVRNAQRWGKRLADFSWDRILASDTGRALRTAQRVNDTLELPLESDARLREQDWGQWTGMTVAEVESLYARIPKEQVGTGWAFCPPGGESRNRMWDRGREILVRTAERWPGANVLVVTHEGTIRCLLNRCLGYRFLAEEPRFMRPYHLHTLRCRDGRLEIEAVNALDLTGKGHAEP